MACLTSKCQERNSFITRMHGEFHRRGFNNSMFDEEVRRLVNDIALAEYTATFATTCNQEVSVWVSLQDPLVSVAVLSVIFCEVFSETQ